MAKSTNVPQSTNEQTPAPVQHTVKTPATEDQMLSYASKAGDVDFEQLSSDYVKFEPGVTYHLVFKGIVVKDLPSLMGNGPDVPTKCVMFYGGPGVGTGINADTVFVSTVESANLPVGSILRVTNKGKAAGKSYFDYTVMCLKAPSNEATPSAIEGDNSTDELQW